MLIRICIYILLLCPALLKGEIIESSKFPEIYTLLKQCESQKTLILCDIDNTLFKASQHLGSVGWSDYIVDQFLDKGISLNDAKEIESILWKTVQPHSKVETIDPETPSILNKLQEQGLLVLGLTARSSPESDCTITQLLSIGINLEKLNQTFSLESLNHETKKPIYKAGVIFATSFHKKSDVLFKFLEENELYPESIIFVDDKISHLEDLSKACEEKNISFYGIRFSGADDDARTFNPKIADLQWCLFPLIISDKEAEELLNS